MQLSKRMQMIADMAAPSSCTADIGTDHGYIPIYLALQGIADHAIAADVRKGPLARARDHIRENGLEERIELRLGDGLTVLHPGEADQIIISGMGGLLMTRILKDSPQIPAAAKALILQPQSDIDLVRRYLHESGFCIEKEDMTIDEGKYYTVIRAVHGKDQEYSAEDDLYGRLLIESGHPVLIRFLQDTVRKQKEIRDHLSGQDSEKCRVRREELELSIAAAEKVFERAERSRRS